MLSFCLNFPAGSGLHVRAPEGFLQRFAVLPASAQYLPPGLPPANAAYDGAESHGIVGDYVITVTK